MMIVEKMVNVGRSLVNLLVGKGNYLSFAKGRIFSEKDWYYLQAYTDVLFCYLKLLNFPASFATG